MEFSLIMDNDSGYVSHNQESNLDSSSENILNNKKSKSFPSHDLYMNEDALLEKPIVKKCSGQRFDSFDSVINSSQESVKTEFSGFEDSDQSDVSFVIPKVKPVVWSRTTDCKENEHASEDGEENVLNCSRGPHVSITSERSPDLFLEEEKLLSKIAIPVREKSPVKKKITNNSDKDVKLLKKVQSCLGGVHPPPSLTVIQMTVTEMLNKIKDNKHLFWVPPDTEVQEKERLSLPRDSQLDFISTQWPAVMNLRHYGLHYNRNKTSEELEHLCSRYAERYVGAETQSTCTVFESNSPCSIKRKSTKPRWMVKSPGRRLSHLARRRITFSNSNLQGTSSSVLGSRARQILVDAKKLTSLHRKSPKKTPSKSPFKIKKNTPSSSAKKKLAMRFREMSGEFDNEPSCSFSDKYGLKRTLFSSPNHQKSSGTSGILMEKKSTKRSLFPSPLKRSPQNKSPFKLGKRKRNDVDEENPSKFARSMSLDLRLNESKLLLNRTCSDTSLRSKNEELSEQHKKKLQWAVYESLRLQNITAAHPQYKVFASVLARVTRKFLTSARLEGRTSEKMFRIARYHSYAVVKGKTVDEIVNEYMKNKMKIQKPQGYIGIEEFQNLKTSSSVADKENILQDKANIMESIDKRREHSGNKSRFFNENRIDRIKKVISFEDK